MKIFLIISAVFVLIIMAVLFLKLRIETEIRVENFKFRLKLKVKVFRIFGIKFETDGKTKEKPKIKKEKKKVTYADVKDIVKRVKTAVPIVGKAVKRSLKIDYFETDISLSLSDPMNTGLGYAALSSAANIFYKSVKMKKQFLDITPDFEKNEGLVLKNICKMHIRPVSILILFLRLYKAGVFNKKGEL